MDIFDFQILIQYPGAILLSLFTKQKITTEALDELVDKNRFKVALIGIAFWLLLFTIIGALVLTLKSH